MSALQEKILEKGEKFAFEFAMVSINHVSGGVFWLVESTRKCQYYLKQVSVLFDLNSDRSV